MATTTQRNYRPRNDQNQKKTEYSVYVRNMISTKIHLKMSEVGDSTKLNLERKIVYKTEGKCIPEGFVRPDSVKIITYSSGVVKMNLIEFQVIFECLICNPVEGQMVECKTKSITKAGIHAEVMTDKKFIPMKIFVARDHNYSNRLFGGIKEEDTINVRIIGKRYELNDPYIVAIASLVDSGSGNGQQQTRQPYQKQVNPRIKVLEDAELNVEDTDEFVEPDKYQDELDEEEPAPISIPTVNPKET
jgi:DNA-directed RNA polymerase subunit E'/Rpb7